VGPFLALTAFALAAQSTPIRQAPSVRPRAEASVTVRIVRGAAVRFDRRNQGPDWKIRDTSVRSDDGRRHSAKLVEFE
jgi:hypothetical protein